MSIHSPVNVCDFGSIYNDSFKYCVPEGVVRSFYEGNSFGRKEKYSAEKQEKLQIDINQIYASIMNENPLQEKIAYITAGSPGAGKTTLLKAHRDEQKLSGRIIAYTDPDDVCLKNMDRTWGEDIANGLRELEGLSQDARLEREKKIREDAYNEWRPGSNAANHLILANLIKRDLAFYFGTTCSSPMTANTFEWLKARGYKIHLIHVIAPDTVRFDSVVERDKTFVQTTPDDMIKKGKDVPQRINDTFLRFADRIDFYYRGEPKQAACLTATWIRTEGASGNLGELYVKDRDSYQTMVSVHNAICQTLDNSKDILWENSVERVSLMK